jgi:chemotaxis response regulator CheB
MVSLLLVTEDNGFAAAAATLSSADLIMTRAHAEEAVTLARHDRPDVVAIDADSIVEAKPLVAVLSLVTGAIVVAVARQAWPGSESADAWRHAGADAVLPKPSGTASPSLAGVDREAYAQWFADLVRTSRENARER